MKAFPVSVDNAGFDGINALKAWSVKMLSIPRLLRLMKTFPVSPERHRVGWYRGSKGVGVVEGVSDVWAVV